MGRLIYLPYFTFGKAGIHMRMFTVNGKEYKAKEFDFNTVCDLEDMGVSLEEMENKPLSMIRAYFQLCAGLGKIEAGKQIEQHLIKGGKMDDVVKAMSKEMEVSDFFQALKAKAEAEAPSNTEEAE